MCCVSAPTNHGLKMRVTYNGAQLTYDLDNAGDYEVFPLQLGSGKYEFALFENVKGSKYSAQGKVVLSAKLADENAAFLVPNQYVDYVRTTNAVLKSDELATQGDVYNAVLDFMKSEFPMISCGPRPFRRARCRRSTSASTTAPASARICPPSWSACCGFRAFPPS